MVEWLLHSLVAGLPDLKVVGSIPSGARLQKKKSPDLPVVYSMEYNPLTDLERSRSRSKFKVKVTMASIPNLKSTF